MVTYRREKRINRKGRIYVYDYEITERNLGLLRVESPFGQSLPANRRRQRSEDLPANSAVEQSAPSMPPCQEDHSNSGRQPSQESLKVVEIASHSNSEPTAPILRVVERSTWKTPMGEGLRCDLLDGHNESRAVFTFGDGWTGWQLKLRDSDAPLANRTFHGLVNQTEGEIQSALKAWWREKGGREA